MPPERCLVLLDFHDLAQGLHHAWPSCASTAVRCSNAKHSTTHNTNEWGGGGFCWRGCLYAPVPAAADVPELRNCDLGRPSPKGLVGKSQGTASAMKNTSKLACEGNMAMQAISTVLLQRGLSPSAVLLSRHRSRSCQQRRIHLSRRAMASGVDLIRLPPRQHHELLLLTVR